MSLHATKYHLKYCDVFHMKSLYVLIHQWLMQEEYGAPPGGWPTQGDKDFDELLYYEKRNPKTGKDWLIWWRAYRTDKSSTYWRRCIAIDYFTLKLKETTVMRKGHKVKAQVGGEIWINVNATLETDYEGKWKNHWLLKYFNEIFWKRILKKNLELQKQDLIRDAYKLQAAIKRFFVAQGEFWEPGRHPFVPRQGLQEY